MEAQRGAFSHPGHPAEGRSLPRPPASNRITQAPRLCQAPQAIRGRMGQASPPTATFAQLTPFREAGSPSLSQLHGEDLAKEAGLRPGEVGAGSWPAPPPGGAPPAAKS